MEEAIFYFFGQRMAVLALEYLDGSLRFIENDPTVGTLGQVRLERYTYLLGDIAVDVVR